MQTPVAPALASVFILAPIAHVCSPPGYWHRSGGPRSS